MKNKLMFIASILLIIFSCNNRGKESLSTVEKMRVEFQNTKNQYFVISSTSDTIIRCVGKTEVLISESSFCDSNNISFDGEVVLEVKEYIKLSDMLTSGLNTLSSKKILETGGMFSIIAKDKDGRLLKLKEDEKIQVKFTSKSNEEFSEFYGNLNNGILEWHNSPAPPVEEPVVVDSVNIGSGVKFQKDDKILNILSFDKLGWLNCDRFLNFTDTTEIFVKTEEGVDTNVFCSVVLKNYNSIIPGKITSNNAVKFSPLPLNEPATLVLIEYKDDSYYLGLKEIVVETKQTYSVAMEKVTKEQLQSKLKMLDSKQKTMLSMR